MRLDDVAAVVSDCEMEPERMLRFEELACDGSFAAALLRREPGLPESVRVVLAAIAALGNTVSDANDLTNTPALLDAMRRQRTALGAALDCCAPQIGVDALWWLRTLALGPDASAVGLRLSSRPFAAPSSGVPSSGAPSSGAPSSGAPSSAEASSAEASPAEASSGAPTSAEALSAEALCGEALCGEALCAEALSAERLPPHARWSARGPS